MVIREIIPSAPGWSLLSSVSRPPHYDVEQASLVVGWHWPVWQPTNPPVSHQTSTPTTINRTLPPLDVSLKSHIWCKTFSLCAINSIILLKYQVVAKEILNYNGGCLVGSEKLAFCCYISRRMKLLLLTASTWIIRIIERSSALTVINKSIDSLHLNIYIMWTENCSSVSYIRYLISARKNCLVSLILKLSIDLILAFHRKLFGSTDLSGLISSAFKDITKIPYNSQLFEYWISEISDDIAAQPSPGFSWDSEMIVTFTDTLLPVGTVQLARDCWEDDWRYWAIVALQYHLRFTTPLQ